MKFECSERYRPRGRSSARTIHVSSEASSNFIVQYKSPSPFRENTGKFRSSNYFGNFGEA